MHPLVPRLIIILVVLLSATVSSSDTSVTVRGEAYIGYSNLDIDLDFGFPGSTSADDKALQGGGAASIAIISSGFYVQADAFGDRAEYNDFDLDTEVAGGGGHLGWRDPDRGSVGIGGTYNSLDPGDEDFGRAGIEGELFLNRVTLSLNGGWAELADDTTGYADIGVAFYPIDRARMNMSGGLYGIDESDPLGYLRVGGEFLFASPVAAFARWEASFLDDGFAEVQQHSIVFGLRLYWGAEEASLQVYDRAHFKPSCIGILLGGARIC